MIPFTGALNARSLQCFVGHRKRQGELFSAECMIQSFCTLEKCFQGCCLYGAARLGPRRSDASSRKEARTSERGDTKSPRPSEAGSLQSAAVVSAGAARGPLDGLAVASKQLARKPEAARRAAIRMGLLGSLSRSFPCSFQPVFTTTGLLV